jgi:hypothetical protein
LSAIASSIIWLAGAPGFEPGNGGIKIGVIQLLLLSGILKKLLKSGSFAINGLALVSE